MVKLYLPMGSRVTRNKPVPFVTDSLINPVSRFRIVIWAEGIRLSDLSLTVPSIAPPVSCASASEGRRAHARLRAAMRRPGRNITFQEQGSAQSGCLGHTHFAPQRPPFAGRTR